MAKRKFRPQQGKHQPAPQQVQVDLSQAETMKCEDCGNYVWIKATVCLLYTSPSPRDDT